MSKDLSFDVDYMRYCEKLGKIACLAFNLQKKGF